MYRIIKNLLLISILLTLPLGGVGGGLAAQQRRPIDSRHPLWLVHIDVWNQADPQKIIDLIPDDIKPYVCMNLSLSCQYDTAKNVYKMPQNAIRTYKSWATVCQANNLWFTCQPASGGHTHIQDNDLETFEYFFKHYPNFLGWNYAEQFWGFDEANDESSSTQTSRIELFSKLVPMSHKYGGLLIVSFCGNIWSHPLNPNGMMKRNADLLNACKQYPDAILWLYKYTTSSCFYNNESVTFGPFIAGLANNYGVRYDNCGYNGALDAILGSNHGKKYPVSAGIGTIMEQTCQNGGAVWDGPELIWTEDFQNLSNTTVSGYTQRNWGTYPGFRNIWLDMFRKIIDGTMYIPTREEVVGKTKFIIINNVTSGSDEDKYATWADLYDGLYKQTDPFNPDGGQWMKNYCYFKSTGRYGTIPMAPCLNDDLAQSIPNKVNKSSRTSVWSSQTVKKNKFNAAYPAVSTGDLFVSRYRNQLVTYTPYTYLNSKTTAKANIPLQYNTCTSLDLTWGKLSSGIVREYADSITFYLNNYRCDTTTNVTDVIVVNGAESEPVYTMTKRVEATATATASYDALTQTYTLSVSHNGPVDLSIHCSGTNTDRNTDVLPSSPLETPRQATEVLGEDTPRTLIKEAEDLNYKNVTSCVTNPYYSYPNVKGHAGNGFVDMGTNTSGTLKAVVTLKEAGTYKVAMRYTSNTSDKTSGTIRFAMNSKATGITLPKTAKNVWNKVSYTVDMKAGNNNFLIVNNNGRSILVDQVIFTPADEEAEKFAVTIRDAEIGGTAVADVEEAAEGDTVTLTVLPDAGYVLTGWNIIHGSVQVSLPREGRGGVSFLMPDDNVTIQPVFKDTTTVYEMDMTNVLVGALPQGWRALESETSIHEYPNTYASGARTFSGFTGPYNKALYWRVSNTDYGKQTNYPLTLQPGDYKLTYAMAAWKGTPSYKAQILSSTGSTIKESAYITATPNANGTTSANLTAIEERTLEFTVTEAGNYVINFANNGTGYSEFLLAECKVNLVPKVITGDVNGDGIVDISDVNAIIAVICGQTPSLNAFVEGQNAEGRDGSADVNADGVVDIADVTAVISIICQQ